MIYNLSFHNHIYRSIFCYTDSCRD